MIRTVHVSGGSDDLIEVGGDVSLEGSASTGSGTVVVNGTPLLELTYTAGGLWRVETIGHVQGVLVQVFATPGEDVPREPKAPAGVASYSDYAVVTGSLASVEVPDDSWHA